MPDKLQLIICQDKAKVTATYNLVSFGTPSTYELCLQTKQLNTPLVLQDNEGSVLQGLNLLPTQPVSLTSGAIAGDSHANLGLSGNLVVAAGFRFIYLYRS